MAKAFGTGFWRSPEEMDADPLVAGPGISGEERASGEGSGRHALHLLLQM